MSVSNPVARLEGHPACQPVWVSLKKAIAKWGPAVNVPDVRSLDSVNAFVSFARLNDEVIELDRVLHDPGEALLFQIETRRNATAEIPVEIIVRYLDPTYNGVKRSFLRCFVEQELELDIRGTGETPVDPPATSATTLAGVVLLTTDGETLEIL